MLKLSFHLFQVPSHFFSQDFYYNCFKVFAREFKSLCHLGVVINQLYCFIPFEVFSLILGMMCNFFFLLKPGHLGYSIMKFQILFKVSVLIDFLWYHSIRENESALCLSLPGGDENTDSQLDFHWHLRGPACWIRMRVWFPIRCW